MEKMRKFKNLIATLLVLIFALPTMVLGVSNLDLNESTSRIFINGNEVSASERGNPPYNVNGHIFLPIRAMATAFDRTTHWEPLTGTLYFGERANPQASYTMVITNENTSNYITLEQILTLEPQAFTAEDRGNTRNFIGLPLTDVLNLMNLDFSDAHRFIFVAADGMTSSAYASEVLDSDNGFLVLGENGEMFTSREDGGRGPFMNVFAKDGVPGRWARNLMEIIVVTSENDNENTIQIERNINVFADGNKVNDYPAPFMLDGVIYLPLRAVALALGKSVEWNGAENAILIGGTPESYDLAYGGDITIIVGNTLHNISMEDILNLGIVDVYATIREERRDYSGVPIATVLDFLNIDTNNATGNVTFNTRDGHGTTGLIEEVITNGFIAIAQDGELLGHWEHGGRGPFMLVFTHDVFAQRFMRYLTEIVIDVCDVYSLELETQQATGIQLTVGENSYVISLELLENLQPIAFEARGRDFTGVAMLDIINHFNINFNIDSFSEGVIISGGDGFSQPFTVEEMLDETNFFLAFEENGMPLITDDGEVSFISVFVHDERNTRNVRGIAEIRLMTTSGNLFSRIEGLSDGEFAIMQGENSWTLTMDDIVALGLVDFTAPWSGDRTRYFTGVPLSIVLESLDVDISGSDGLITTSWDSVFQAAWSVYDALNVVYIVVGEDGEPLAERYGPFFGVAVGRGSNFAPRNLQSIRIN